jgi:hypothetical protein
MPEQPPAQAQIVALSVPLFMSAGAVNGVAVAAARIEDVMYYLVDNALVDGPPLWIHEGEIERCFVAALPVTDPRIG